MKRVLALFAAMVFTVTIGGAAASETEGVAAIFPGDTQIMFQMESLSALYAQLDVKSETFMGEPIKDLDKVKEQFGFNPFDLAAVKAAGFNTDKRIGIALSGLLIPETEEGKPAFNGAFAFPVTDAAKATETLKRFMAKDTPGITFKEDGGMTIAVHPEKGTNGVIAAKDGYLFLGGKAQEPKLDLVAWMKGFRAGATPLATIKAYKSAVKNIGPSSDMVMFANIQEVSKYNKAAIDKLVEGMEPQNASLKAQLAFIEDYEALAVGMDFSGPDLTAESAVTFMPNSDLIKLLKGWEFTKKTAFGIPEHPVMLISSAFNPVEYYQKVLEILTPEQKSQFETQVEKMKADFQIDLKADVIENLSGNINLGLYDGMTINMANYNTLITIGVKDEAKARALLEKAVKMEPTTPERPKMIQPVEVMGVGSYMANIAGMIQVFAGVKDKSIIVASGKPMYDKALAAEMEKGFTTRIPDKKLAETLRSERILTYINMAELLSAVKNFSMMIQQFTGENPITPETEAELRKLDYLVASSWPEGNAVYGDMVFKTNFTGPFFPEFVKIVKTLVPEKPEGEAAESPSGSGEPRTETTPQ